MSRYIYPLQPCAGADCSRTIIPSKGRGRWKAFCCNACKQYTYRLAQGSKPTKKSHHSAGCRSARRRSAA